MRSETELEGDFWRIFGRVLGRSIAPGRYQRAQLPEWDSLRHIELIFELEEKLGVEVPKDSIAALYSDTDTILGFLRTRVTTAR